MKHNVELFFIVALSLLVTSCIEITQHVRIENNVIISNTRFVIQKALISMAQSYSNDTDLSELAFTEETIQQLQTQIPKENLVRITNIENELETGIDITVRYPGTKQSVIIPDNDAPLFFPYLKDRTLVVDIANKTATNFDESNQIAMAILSGFKYRLFIDKSVLATPEQATLYDDDNESYQLPLITYPNFSMVEISMAFLLSGKSLHLVVE